MANIHKSVLELVGNTPLVEVTNYEEKHHLKGRLIGKLEFLNPSGSVKDRIAKSLVEDGIARGKVSEGGTIVDCTSGNTGISLATVCAVHKLQLDLYLDPGTTKERQQVYDAFGLDVKTLYDLDEVKDFEKTGLVLDDLIAGLQRVADEKENAYYVSQTQNEVNQETHYKTTGPEIWRDTDGKVDYFVALGGTAGTLVGVGRYLREKNPDVKIIGVQAAPSSRPDSPDFTGKIIDGTLPVGNVDESLIPTLIRTNLNNGFHFDEIIDVKAEDAYETAQDVIQTDGLFLGTSAAAALTAGRRIAERPEAEGKNIVVIFPDNGYKYLSTDLFKRNK